MWDNNAGGRVYLAVGTTDMRKQINGLSILVQETMELDPFSGSVYVFCNRQRSIVKALYWDRNGFCLWQKRQGKERELKGTELLQFRREHAVALLEEFRNWLQSRVGATPPKGLLGAAMNYTLKQWKRLVVYVNDPNVGLDNNAAENASRPFAVGRKNWLFAGSPAGAQASANLYSLVESAKASGREPYRYLRFVFDRLPYARTPEDYRKLTPLHLDRSEFDAALPQWR